MLKKEHSFPCYICVCSKENPHICPRSRVFIRACPFNPRCRSRQCVYFLSFVVCFFFGGEGYALTCMFGWIRWLYAFHIVLSLLSGCPQRGRCTAKAQVTSCPRRPREASSSVVSSALQGQITAASYYTVLLIWYICTVLVHVLKMSGSAERIKSPLKGLHFLLFFFLLLMIKTWALVALIKRLCHFPPAQVQGQPPAIERMKICWERALSLNLS